MTDRDRMVAKLVPPRPAGAEWVDDARLAGLVRDGIVRPPLLPRGAVPPRQPVAPTHETLRELSADRDAG